MKNKFISILWPICTVIALMGCNLISPKNGYIERADVGEKTDKPNIVWIISEDNSSDYLQLYSERGAKTPAIEKLAQQGITFDNAYSNGAVCSVARTTLATGVYAPKMASQYHRASFTVNVPEGGQLIHQYLQDIGYYTTNNSKLDYNLNYLQHGAETWHESGHSATWQNRKNNKQPFFHIQTIKDTHESRLLFNQKNIRENKHKYNLGEIKLAPYLPDTDVSRYTHAFYNEKIRVMDSKVSDIINDLEKAGELENTFVFYFGDHGGVLPRSKGYIYDSGTRVPLVVRVPKNYKHLVNSPTHSRIQNIVEFVDLSATTLHIAGVDIPEYIDGKAFLGKNVHLNKAEPHNIALLYADKMGEKFDLVRGLRKGKYKYIRSYQPYLPDGLSNNYRFEMLAYKEWVELYKTSQLNATSSAFFKPKSPELLFDVSNDPHEITNLANNPEFKNVLLEMRDSLNSTLTDLPDLGFYPESYLAQHITNQQPIAFGQRNKQELSQLINIANLQVLPYRQARSGIINALKSSKPMMRYWGVTVAASFGEQASELWPLIKPLINDNLAIIRTRTAEFMAVSLNKSAIDGLAITVNRSLKYIEILEALSAMKFIKEFHPHLFKVVKLSPRIKTSQISGVIKSLNK